VNQTCFAENVKLYQKPTFDRSSFQEVSAQLAAKPMPSYLIAIYVFIYHNKRRKYKALPCFKQNVAVD